MKVTVRKRGKISKNRFELSRCIKQLINELCIVITALQIVDCD